MLCLRDTLAVDLVEVGVKVVKDGVKACAFAVGIECGYENRRKEETK